MKSWANVCNMMHNKGLKFLKICIYGEKPIKDSKRIQTRNLQKDKIQMTNMHRRCLILLGIKN